MDEGFRPRIDPQAGPGDLKGATQPRRQVAPHGGGGDGPALDPVAGDERQGLTQPHGAGRHVEQPTEHRPADELLARCEAVASLPVAGAERPGGSTWQSLARGTGDLETPYLNGEIVRLGERLGIATPRNRALVELSEQALRERWAPGSLSRDALEARLLA